MATVIDIECFFGNHGFPVIKELAIAGKDGDRIVSQTFLPPCEWRRLPSYIRRQNAWITRHLNHFRWSDGELPQDEIDQFLKANVDIDSTVYAKGRMKCELLTTFLGRRVHNLEDLGCPKAKELGGIAVACPHAEIFPSHTDESSCAVKKCRAFSNWLKDGRGEDTVW